MFASFLPLPAWRDPSSQDVYRYAILFDSREEQDLPGVILDTTGFTHCLRYPCICKDSGLSCKPPLGVTGDLPVDTCEGMYKHFLQV